MDRTTVQTNGRHSADGGWPGGPGWVESARAEDGADGPYLVGDEGAALSEGFIEEPLGGAALAVASKALSGRYVLEDAIGHTALATTYRAIDRDSDRTVALKLFSEQLSEHREFRQRVLQLAGQLATVEHPNIGGVLDAGLDDGRLYVVTELVEGKPLRRVLQETGPLSVERAIAIGSQVAEGLASAHQRGIVHGNLNPDNILLSDSGRAKVVDFGLTPLALALGLLPLATLAERAAYLSPEQVMGAAPGRRSDVYALAVVLYEALAGAPPFGGGNLLAMASQRLVREPESLRRVHTEVPVEVDNIILRALAPNPVERYGSATEFRAALVERELAVQLRTPPEPLIDIDTRPRRREWESGAEGLAVLMPILGTMGVGLLAFVVYTLFLSKGFSFLQYAEVPNLSGRTLGEAAQLARAAGMDVTVERIEATDDKPKDTVVAHIPPTGERASRGSPIKLIVSSGIKTPDLRGMGLNNARVFLIKANWKPGRVETQVAPGVPIGTVVGQRPGPGEVVPERAEVALVVAGGNFAEGAQVSASSGQNPGAAVDGNEQTSWMPNAPVPQWIELDLKVPVTIGSIELMAAQRRTEPTINEIWATNEAGDFFPIFTFHATTQDGQKLQARLEKPVDNVVRVRIATVQSAGGVGWREIRLLTGTLASGPSETAVATPGDSAQPPLLQQTAPRQMVVANTDGQGVFIRKTPNIDDRIRAWREGTRLEVRGQERVENGIRWVGVRDPSGNEGWVPAQYTKPAD